MTTDELRQRAQVIVETWDATASFDSDSYAALADDAIGLAKGVLTTVHVGLKTYGDAKAAACGLVEEPNVDSPARREYMRGMVELIADLFGFPPDKSYIAERKFEIAMDLNWPPEMVE